MASSAIHVSNMKESISAGEVPGKFDESRTVFEFPTLSYVGARGAVHLWTVRVRLIRGTEYAPITDEMLDQPAPAMAGYKAELTVEAQQQGGKVRDTVPTYVSAGKNVGKKNATNCLTQALRDALSLYNKQRKKGDPSAASASAAAASASASAAADSRSSAAATAEFDSRPPPMLVKKIGDSREATLTPADFAAGVTVQRKLNGVHYVAFAQDTGAVGRKLVRYSRTSAEYPGQEQISDELLPMLFAAPRVLPGEYGTPEVSDAATERIAQAYGDNTLPYFDGELYLHGKSLNWISGQARRGDDEGILEFHVFDVFFPHAKAAGHDMESRHRQAYLDAVFAEAARANLAHPHIKRVENFPAASAAEMEALAERFISEGFEGAIARKDAAGYRYGYSNYHSANLLKIKPVHDAEFTVVGYTQGVRGKDVGAVIWECEVPDPVDPRDRNFTVVPKDMTYEDRYALFACLGEVVESPISRVRVTRFERDFKGLPLTVEYREVSEKTGKPLQAKALTFRTYESGPEADPVRAAILECRSAAAERR